MTCYCRNDTPCQPCLDIAYEEQASTSILDAQAAFLSASADFYIPGWTPDDEDARNSDINLLDKWEA